MGEMAYYCFTTFLCIVTFMGFSLGADTLFPNQTIENGQTLISQSQIFELGFFRPGSSKNVFLGIWYKKTPDVVVWVANRNNPITDSKGIFLAISRNGTLVITGDGRIIWSTNSSGVPSNPILQLLDTGNLVLADTVSKGYTWQSFDFPTDTRLPGMLMVEGKSFTSWRGSDDPSTGDFTYKLENQGLPELVLSRGPIKRYGTGPWNGFYFSGIAPWNSSFQYEVISNKDFSISFIEVYDSSIVTRIKVETSGMINRYTMDERREKWNIVHTVPRDPCDNYAQCGPYGICSIDREPICECLKGFAPKKEHAWDWSSGCSRIRPLSCQNGDGFLPITGVKFPAMLKFWLNTSMNLGECELECLKTCDCTAYANLNIMGGGSRCLIWFGDLVDIREIRGADRKQIIYIRLPASELESKSKLEKNKKEMSGKLIAALTTAGFLLSCLICFSILMIIRLKRRGKSKTEDLELPLFKMTAIAAATNKFSSENMIGEGGFGPVYKGKLSSEEEIAVKRLSRTSGQGLEEFKNEVILIAKLQHRNLVRLLGCCIEGDERLLIYEYMQNKSLDYFIFDKNKKALLTWPLRFCIITGISRGLLYLHDDSRLKIIHRDLKTSNILLDGNFNPKISDFGLARTFGGDQTTARTKRVMGTYGYMAPEYAIDGKFSVKSDIFSLGVVLLEIVSGKRNRGFSYCNHNHSLLGHAWLLWKENKALEIMDDCLKDSFVESQAKRCIQVGLLCVQKFPENRPVISSMLHMLRTEGAVLPEPKEPGFFMEMTCNRSAESDSMVSVDSMTITDFGPR